MNEIASFFQNVPVGYIVLSVVLIPVLVMAICGVTTRPRNLIVPAIFTSAVVVLIAGMVAGFAVIGFVLKFVVPQ
jgi:hypothetical protein